MIPFRAVIFHALLLLAASPIPVGAGKIAREPRRTDVIALPSGTASLEPLATLPGYRLSVTTHQGAHAFRHHIPYPVYRFDAADVNNDGSTDILVGVIKKTHFDPVERRRLFIYRITGDGIVPLWLGSRVCMELVDFRATREGNETRVLTIERTKQGAYCNGLYTWHGFGLELIRYSTISVSYDTALAYFDHARDPRNM
jgi:hypothetical protein